MKYRIKNVYGEVYQVESKAELFDAFDTIACVRPNLYSLQRLKECVTDNFIIKRTGRFEVEREHIDVKTSDGEYYQTIKYKMSNGFYIVYTEFGYKVNLEELIEQYSQSRNYKVYKSNYIQRNYSTKKSQLKSRKRHGEKTIKSAGLKKEYKDSFYAQELNIKVRSKRLDKVREHHVHLYDDYGDYDNYQKSWKKHRKNQYR